MWSSSNTQDSVGVTVIFALSCSACYGFEQTAFFLSYFDQFSSHSFKPHQKKMCRNFESCSQAIIDVSLDNGKKNVLLIIGDK